MAATAGQVAELRAMIAEPTTATYSDSALEDAIEGYPVTDSLGQEWYTWDYSATPPSKVAYSSWVPTYDLHAAAARIWANKAALVAGNFDFSADGGSFSRSQAYKQYMQQSRVHAAQRVPRTQLQLMSPRRVGVEVYPLNAAEVD